MKKCEWFCTIDYRYSHVLYLSKNMEDVAFLLLWRGLVFIHLMTFTKSYILSLARIRTERNWFFVKNNFWSNRIYSFTYQMTSVLPRYIIIWDWKIRVVEIPQLNSGLTVPSTSVQDLGKVIKYINIRLSGCLAPIFYLNCLPFGGFYKKNFVDLQISMKIEFFVGNNLLKFWLSIKPSLGLCEVPQKIWARSVQPFWRLFDTNKQTDKQSIYKYRR